MPTLSKNFNKNIIEKFSFISLSGFLRLLIISFLLIAIPSFSQNKKLDTEAQRDKMYELVRQSDKYTGIDDLKSLQLAKEATKIAEEIGTSKDKVTAYMIIANTLSNLGIYDKSFTYIEKALNESFAKENINFQVILKAIKANNYWMLDLKKQAIAEQKSIIKIVDSEQKKYSLTYSKATAYKYLGIWNSELKKQDSALYYLNKSEAIFKTFPKDETTVHYIDIPTIYSEKGKAYLLKNNLDSAYQNINEGFTIINKSPEKPSTLHNFYYTFGDYYFAKKDYQKAIDFYLKSIKEMNLHHINDTETRIKAFKNISVVYGLLKQPQKREEFLNKYFTEKEKHSEKNTENVQKAVEYILSEKNTEMLLNEKRTKTGLVMTTILLIIIAIVLYRIYKIKQKNTLQELKIKEDIISRKEEQTKELEQKVNSSFQEIIDLAKENHPNFYTRFQEVYPTFQKKLLAIDSTLQNSELILLAYIYLNFETKEIANYLFKAPKTIQNRKHHLRKKLQIPSSEDIAVWLKTL